MILCLGCANLLRGGREPKTKKGLVTMPIHCIVVFGQGRATAHSPMAFEMLRTVSDGAANDNHSGVAGDLLEGHNSSPADQILQAALKHFAEHGLGAARAARAKAERAFFAGDKAAYLWWLDITRALDRRVAMEAERFASSPKRLRRHRVERFVQDPHVYHGE